MLRRLTDARGSCGGGAGPVAAPALGATIPVDDDSMASPSNCNAATPASPTVQGGVNAAAPGDTVRVCPGTYAGDRRAFGEQERHARWSRS